MEQARAEDKTTSAVMFISRASVMDESFSVFGLWRTKPS